MVCMLHLVKVFYPAVQDEVIIILLIITYLVRIIQMFFMFHVHRLGLLYSDWSGEYKGKSVGVRLTDQQFQHLKGPRRGTQTPCKTGNPIKREKRFQCFRRVVFVNTHSDSYQSVASGSRRVGPQESGTGVVRRQNGTAAVVLEVITLRIKSKFLLLASRWKIRF